MDKPANGGSEEAAGRGLALLSTIGRILDAVDDDYAVAIEAVAAACVPAFADLCAIECSAPVGRLGPWAPGRWPRAAAFSCPRGGSISSRGRRGPVGAAGA